MVDLIVVGLIVLFGALGAFSGALKQLGHWIGLIGAYLLCGPLAAAAAPALAGKFGLPAAGVKIGLSAFGFYPLFLGLSFLAGLILHKAFGAQERAPWDRSAGFALGAVKGAVLVYVPLSLWIFMEGRLPGAVAADFTVPKSASTDFVRRHNLFTKIKLPALANAEKLMQAAKDPQAALALAGDPKMAAMLENPELKSALQDQGIVKAFETGDLDALQKDPRIMKLLQDPRLAGQMPDLDKAMKADQP